MKLLLVTPAYPPTSVGGVATFTFELANILARLGIGVTVVCPSYGRSISSMESAVKVYRLSSPKIPPKELWFYFRNYRRISKIMRVEEPSIIHSSKGFAEFMPWLTHISKLVLTVHGSPSISQVRSKGSRTDRLRGLAVKLANDIPTAFVALFANAQIAAYVHVSRYSMNDNLARITTQEQRKRIAEKCLIIYSGVDLNDIRRIVSGIDVRPLSIAFVARLVEYKGLFPLLQAFKRVIEIVPDASLEVVGAGPMSSSAQDFVRRNGMARNVQFKGQLSRDDSLKVIARSKFLVHPSMYESQGLSIVEAYALGKPVIVHNAGYSKEIVKETQAGLIVDVNDLFEFSSAIVKLMTDENLYSALSANAKKAAEQQFATENMGRSYISLFKRLAET